MQANRITKLLGIQGLRVTGFEIRENEGYIFHVKSSKQFAKCPYCGHRARSVHDRRIQRVRDIPYNGKPTLWYLTKRRFNCSCGRRFTEEFKALGKHRQLSNRLYSEILKELNEITSFAQVARRFRVSVPTVRRVPDLISINDRPKLPER